MKPKKENKLDQLVGRLRRENDDLKRRLARALADYHNFEARANRQLERSLAKAQVEMIKDMLIVYEAVVNLYNYDNSAEHKAVLSTFDNFLNKYKITKLKVKEGDVFDPAISECLQIETGRKDRVTQVVRPGFKLGDLIIKPALVKVGAGIKKDKKN